MSKGLPTIYLEAPVLIDMAQVEAKQTLEKSISDGVWYCKQALKAARDGRIKVLTSFISIAECTGVETGKPSPPEDIRRFYDMLLASGKSGLALVAPTSQIMFRARDLKWLDSLNLKGMDAIHLATALQMRCDEIWTRDGRIWKSRDTVKQYGIQPVRPQETTVLPQAYRQEQLL